MRAREFILLEAKPETLGNGMLEKLFATYQTRDINDTTLPNKFENGHQIATYIYQFIGPNYLTWVAKQYNQDQHFFLHDLPNWGDTLTQFSTIVKDNRIQIEKDINRYQNIDQLRTAIEQASGTKQNLGSKFYSSAISAIDEFVKKKEASWLYKGTDYSIYYPKTFESSNLCSKLMSTTVCTIMNKYYFDEYSKHGTLMYIISQDKLYNCFISKDASSKNSEFADEKNNHSEYDLKWMLSSFPALKPLVKRASTPKTEFLVQMLVADTKEEAYENGMAAVKQECEALSDVPEELRDYEICMAAVKQDGDALYWVPEELLDYYEICMAAVKQHGRALEHVPEELRDYEICMVAVKQNGVALREVPEELRDKVKAAITNKTNESAELDRLKQLSGLL